jgi:hypothetical protein
MEAERAIQRPTVLEGILVALVMSLASAPVIFALRLLLGAVMAWKAALVIMAYAYIVYLLVQRGRVAGRVTLAVLSLLIGLGCLAYGVSWEALVLVTAALIWGGRVCLYSHSLVSALLHGGLCLLGLVAALWAYTSSGSVALATWCFFLTQAACGFIPPRLAGTATEPASDDPAADRFAMAYQAAQKALRQLHNASG